MVLVYVEKYTIGVNKLKDHQCMCEERGVDESTQWLK